MISVDYLKKKWGISAGPIDESVDLKYRKLFHEAANRESPSIDVFENAREIVVVIHLPGYSKENVRLKIEDSGLRLKASKSFHGEEKEEKSWFVHSAAAKEEQEHIVSEYVDFPSRVDASKARASFKNGVLEVIVQKRN